MTPEAAYAEVERLVKKFKGLSTAERRNYNEAATRQGFILPLFHALGWDTADPAEVSPEEKVSRGLDDRRHALKRRIDEVDREIDRRVYDLYGLTAEEIAIVEGGRRA